MITEASATIHASQASALAEELSSEPHAVSNSSADAVPALITCLVLNLVIPRRYGLAGAQAR